MTLGTQNAIVWLLKIAASLMLFVVMTADVMLCTAWVAAAFIEGGMNKIPFWWILLAAVFSFGQVLISSFLYGVAKQVTSSTLAGGADAESMDLGDRISNTIDDGWPTSTKLSALFAAIAGALVVCAIGIFFNDLKFLVGVHRGMELESTREFKDSSKWFEMSMDTGDKARVPIARFMYAGSLLRAGNFAEAESELKTTLAELDPKNEDQQALYVYALSALSNCYLFQNKLDQSEKYASDAVKMLQEHPHMLGLSFRMIGPYKQFLIPEPPPLEVAISGLNDIYVREGKLESALESYKQILKELATKPSLQTQTICSELHRFEDQLSSVKDVDTKPVFLQAMSKSADLAVKRSGIKNGADFEQKYAHFKKQVDSP